MDSWVSVAVRKPRNHRKVIIFCAKYGVDVGGWHSKEFGWLHSDGTQAEAVTHWMPIPRPPRKKGVC